MIQLELIKTEIKYIESNERYTPHHIVEIITNSLGGKIDLDPTSNPSKTTNAQIYYTASDNCLTMDWDKVGTAFMNPPFSDSEPFIRKWLEMFERGKFQSGITLTLAGAVFNKGTQDYFRKAEFLVIPKGRIEFVFPDHRKTNGNDRDVIFAYWGKCYTDIVVAKSHLSKLGLIVDINS